VTAPGWQVPAPSHFPAAVWLPAVQVPAPQTVPDAKSSQAPLPSQNPSCWQVDAVCAAHWLSGS